MIHTQRSVIEKAAIVEAIYWYPANIKLCEEFVYKYKGTYDYTFEYTTHGGWIIKWRTSYKTLHDGDVLVRGFKYLLILSREEFDNRFTVIDY
jgi:hypothetical protein